MVDHEGREALHARAKQDLDALWHDARRAGEEDDRPVTSGLFIESLDELIDSYGRRDAALNRHVPELVLFSLYGAFFMTGSIVGYAAGFTGHRASYVTYVLVAPIVLLVFITIDLDRPRRGLIEVSQRSVTDLQASIATEPSLPSERRRPEG
jgi:hypothetical protein